MATRHDKLHRKLGVKLIALVGITAITIIGVYSYFSIRAQSTSLLAEVERHANQLSETVRKSTRYGMMLNQRDYVHEIINDVGTDPAIEEVRVLNKEGKIIYSSNAENIGRMVDKKAESCFACHAADRPLQRLPVAERARIFQVAANFPRMLGIVTPIYNEPACWEAECHAHPERQAVLGVLDITTSLAVVDDEIQRSELKHGLFALIAVVAISIIIGFFVRRWVDAPVTALLAATEAVGKGNLSYRIETGTEDEIGRLARSFNTMTQKLSEARLQLFQSDKMASLGRLAAGVAHELNNPLTGVLTYSSFLLNRAKDNPEVQADLEVIVRETTRSREIVKSLLDFARQSVPRMARTNLNEIIERSVGVMDKQLTVRGIRLMRELDATLPLVRADANQMEQVFINLLVNAADAIGDKGGVITVRSKAITLLPHGVVPIKRAFCRKGHDLMASEVKIDGLPSIRVKARSEGQEGFIALDPVFGSGRHHYDLDVKPDATPTYLCPRCGVSLLDNESKCPRCGAPICVLNVPPHGLIQLCTRRGCSWQHWEAMEAAGRRQYVEVRVEDNGAGVAAEELDKIFEPFYTTKGQKGTGLGLAVIWGIIDNHDGTIKVESTVGKGTVFTIRLSPDQDR